MTEGQVYFATDGEAIKIGFSGAPSLRLQDLQSANHRQLRLLKTIEGNQDTETALHQRFSHLHIRGEWFRSDPELLDFINGPGPRTLKTEVREVLSELNVWSGDKSEKVKNDCLGLGHLLNFLADHPDHLGNRQSAMLVIANIERSARKTAAEGDEG